MNDWQECKLGDVANYSTGKLNSNAAVQNGCYPFFTCSPETLHIDSFAFDTEALILAGNNAEGVFSLKYYNGKFNAYQRTYIIKVADETRTDYKFLFYGLKIQLSNLEIISHGTATKYLTLPILNDIPVLLPPLPEQRAIAAVLSSLDDKIDLLHHQNKTLEGLAETLWRKMFVEDVDPTWKITVFSDHIGASRGLSYKGNGLAEKNVGIPMHNLNSVYEGGGYKYEGIKYYTGNYQDRHVIKPGDIIVTNTEQGHEFRLIGFPAVVPHCFGEKGIFSQHIYKLNILKKSYLTSQYIYYLIMTPKVREQIIGATNGSTVNMLAIDGLQRPEFNLPPEEKVKQFSETVKLFWQKQADNKTEIGTLSTLRDSLLPKLMSGEVRVKV